MKDYTVIICEETMAISTGYPLGREIEGGRREGSTLSAVFLYRLKTTI